jgi:Predicted nucleic-acid-binding protein implicated in transcription termination
MRNPRNERVSSDIDSAGPERTCILSGGKAARDTLVRLAISPDGLVLPDVHARAPGRGAWLGVSRGPLEIALAKGKLKGALARAYKGAPLSIPEDLAERIEQALIRALTERLGLELKSGKLLMGSDRIAQNAREGRVVWLGHASDAREDGARKLDQAWRVGSDAEGTGLKGTRLPLDRETLSVALGRDNVVHLALNDRGAADRVASLLQRLLHFQGQAEPAAADMDDGDDGQATAAPATTN